MDGADLIRFYRGRKVLVTGGNGFVGRHLCAHLRENLGARVQSPPSHDLDLTRPNSLIEFEYRFGGNHLVFHLAGVTGGIDALRHNPFSYLEPNARMALEVAAFAAAAPMVPVVAAGSVCAYPQHTSMPMTEENLWIGKPEETNFPYGESKRLLLAALDAVNAQYGARYAYLLLANMYGPGDHFDDERAHVIPSLITRFYAAKQQELPEVEIWGTGQASRDFLYVKDAVDAFVRAGYAISQSADAAPLVCNIGSGHETRISALAYMIGSMLDYAGKTVFDTTRPDGQPRRVLRIERAKRMLDWTPQTDIVAGLERTIDFYTRKKIRDDSRV